MSILNIFDTTCTQTKLVSYLLNTRIVIKKKILIAIVKYRKTRNRGAIYVSLIQLLLDWLYQACKVDGGWSVQAESCIWGKEYGYLLSGHWSAIRSLYHQTPNRYIWLDAAVCSLPTVLSFIFCNVLIFSTYIVICLRFS